MTITLFWIPAGALRPKSFVLADSPANIPMNRFRLTGNRMTQAVRFFRGNTVSMKDRGNRKATVTFETSRLFGSSLEAESFLLMHETQFPGLFLARFTSGTGSATVSFYLANAVLESMSSQITGCTTRHSYKITGGAMSLTSG